MCITTAEMNQKMEKRKNMQMQLKKMEDDIKALDMDIIEYLMDNLNDCLTTNSKGKENLQFIGNMCKATYSPQERETVDKEEVKKLLNDKDYQKVRKVSYYSVLRVSQRMVLPAQGDWVPPRKPHSGGNENAYTGN